MKITIIRTTKDDTGTTVHRADFNELITSYIEKRNNDAVIRHREVSPYFGKPESCQGCIHIVSPWTAGEYYIKKSVECVFRAKNGIGVVKLLHFCPSLEAEKVKNALRMMPRALFAFICADNHSVGI